MWYVSTNKAQTMCAEAARMLTNNWIIRYFTALTSSSAEAARMLTNNWIIRCLTALTSSSVSTKKMYSDLQVWFTSLKIEATSWKSVQSELCVTENLFPISEILSFANIIGLFWKHSLFWKITLICKPWNWSYTLQECAVWTLREGELVSHFRNIY